MILENEEISGITFKINDFESEHKLGQYADDTFLTLDGSERSLRSTFQTLRAFEQISNLKINENKCSAMWVGSKKEPICKDLRLDWNRKEIKILGIIFAPNVKRTIELNYESKINEVKSLLGKWEYRTLTIIGKITVVKSLALSKFIHIGSMEYNSTTKQKLA